MRQKYYLQSEESFCSVPSFSSIGLYSLPTRVQNRVREEGACLRELTGEAKYAH